MEGAELEFAEDLVGLLVQFLRLEGDADDELLVLDEGHALSDDVVRICALGPGIAVHVVHVADDPVVLEAGEVPLVHRDDGAVAVYGVVAGHELHSPFLLVDLADVRGILPASKKFLFHGYSAALVVTLISEPYWYSPSHLTYSLMSY